MGINFDPPFSTLCPNNTPYNTSTFEPDDYALAELPILITGSIIFLMILPLVLFEFPLFPIGTTPSVLFGATLMVICQVSMHHVYQTT